MSRKDRRKKIKKDYFKDSIPNPWSAKNTIMLIWNLIQVIVGLLVLVGLLVITYPIWYLFYLFIKTMLGWR